MFTDKIMLFIVGLFTTTIIVLLYAGVVTPTNKTQIQNNKPVQVPTTLLENQKPQVSVSNTLPPYKEVTYREDELLDYNDPEFDKIRNQWFSKYANGRPEYETVYVNKSIILPAKNMWVSLYTGAVGDIPLKLKEEYGYEIAGFTKKYVYRSCSEQRRRYEAYAKKHGYEEADKTIERPLHSEMQIYPISWQIHDNKGNILGSKPEDQKVIEWLEQHAHESGWIIRYPKGKEHITGYKYRPYHLRFVGQELATKLYQNNQTLEEHFNYLNLKNEYFYPYDHISNYQHLDSIGCTIDGE